MLENFTPLGYPLEVHLFAFILGTRDYTCSAHEIVDNDHVAIMH